MKTKTFLGLPVINSAGLYAVIRNYLSVILFTGIPYVVLASVFNVFQTSEKNYILQAILLIVSLILGHFTRVSVNKLFGDKFFMVPKYDKFFYPAGLILTYLIINEIWGL